MTDSSDALAELLTLTLTVDEFGTRIYLNSNGQKHRQHGPAVEYLTGTKYWYLNGTFHRTTGAAVEYADGSKYWYLDGEHLTEGEFIIVMVTKYPSGNPVQQCDSH